MRGRGAHPDRPRPIRIRCRTGLGATPVHRLVHRRCCSASAPASRCGCCSTAATRWDSDLARTGWALGRRWPRSAGAVSRTSPREAQLAAVLEVRALPRRTCRIAGRRCHPSRRSRCSEVSARSRCCCRRPCGTGRPDRQHDRDDQQQRDPGRLASISASRPSVRNPTAKWAIGEIRMTTGLRIGGAHSHRHLCTVCRGAGTFGHPD